MQQEDRDDHVESFAVMWLGTFDEGDIAKTQPLSIAARLPYCGGRQIKSHQLGDVWREQKLGVPNSTSEAQDTRRSLGSRQVKNALGEVFTKSPHGEAREVFLRETRVQFLVVRALSLKDRIRGGQIAF